VNFKDFKKIKGFSIVVIPIGGSVETKSHHFSSGKITAFVVTFTIIVFFLGFFLLNITPVRTVFFPRQQNLTPSEKQLIDELNKRLTFLATQLENLKSTNHQLKDAIMLGDSTLLDSLKNKINTETKAKVNPIGGDIFSVFRMLFFSDSAKNTYSVHFSMPVNGFISRGFDPSTGHMGIDIVVKKGTPIYAAASGYVIFSDYTVRDGYMMIIGHSDGYITVYKHCSSLLKKARDIVLEGEIIALSGNSGEITTGPHLHFEIWKDGKPINPVNLLINY
jgi:murein DD-endopeptidase MepM/ murein hydrolase activator NlpD